MRHLAGFAVLLVLVVVLLSACDGSVDRAAAGEVVVHGFDPAARDPWVGLIVEGGAGPEFVFLAAGTQPWNLGSGDPLGMYSTGIVRVTVERGSPGPVLSRANLIEVTDSPPGEPASVEMVWLGWQGDDPSPYEIQAALG